MHHKGGVQALSCTTQSADPHHRKYGLTAQCSGPLAGCVENENIAAKIEDICLEIAMTGRWPLENARGNTQHELTKTVSYLISQRQMLTYSSNALLLGQFGLQDKLRSEWMLCQQVPKVYRTRWFIYCHQHRRRTKSRRCSQPCGTFGNLEMTIDSIGVVGLFCR